jgi:hypothetical protein
VDIDVERQHRSVSLFDHNLESVESRLFARLVQRHGQSVGLAIGMTTRLEPGTQLLVVNEEKASPPG